MSIPENLYDKNYFFMQLMTINRAFNFLHDYVFSDILLIYILSTEVMPNILGRHL